MPRKKKQSNWIQDEKLEEKDGLSEESGESDLDEELDEELGEEDEDLTGI